MYRNIKPLSNVDTMSMGPAIIKIYPISFLNMCQSELKADSKISAGMNKRRSKCGSIMPHMSNDFSKLILVKSNDEAEDGDQAGVGDARPPSKLLKDLSNNHADE